MYLLIAVLQKLKNKKREDRSNEGSLHPAFLHVFAFFDAVRKRHIIILFSNSSPLGQFWVPFWRPLDFKGVPKSIVFLENAKN